MTQGTIQRDKLYVYGTCVTCNEENVLVYNAADNLICAYCYREWARVQPKDPVCDRCGKHDKVVRDPSHRRNEYLCFSCHADDGFLPADTATYRAFKATAPGGDETK
jgi:hypothetical protein